MDASTQHQNSEPAHESVVQRRREAIRRTRGIVAGLSPEPGLSEELIAERHEEAHREGAFLPARREHRPQLSS